MNGLLPSLAGVMIFSFSSYSAATDTIEPISTKIDTLRAAVTDMPDIVDMSHADPKTWSSLRWTAQRLVWASNPIEIDFSGARPSGEW
jgi:hypothetical protein